MAQLVRLGGGGVSKEVLADREPLRYSVCRSCKPPSLRPIRLTTAIGGMLPSKERYVCMHDIGMVVLNWWNVPLEWNGIVEWP